MFMEIFLYVAYGGSLVVWAVISFLLVRHIQALTDIQGFIKFLVFLYFLVSIGLIAFSLFFLLQIPFEPTLGLGSGPNWEL